MSGHPVLPADPITLPLLPLRDVVVFPHMVIPLFVGRPKSIKALEAAMENGRQIMLVAQKAAGKDEPKADDMFDIGCVSSILQMLKLPDGTVKVLVEGMQRATTVRIDDNGEHFVAEVTPIVPEQGPSPEVEALRRAVTQQFDQYVKLNKKIHRKSSPPSRASTMPVAWPTPSPPICRSSSSTSSRSSTFLRSMRGLKNCSNSSSTKSTSCRSRNAFAGA